MAKAKKKKQSRSSNNLLKKAGVIEARGDNDTIRLWENYREQALMWRAIALVQIPATLIALGFALVMFNNRSIIFSVPAAPLPGFYLVDEIPDEEFVSVATDFINLISTYQPGSAVRQFEKASEYLVEPYLARYRAEILKEELQAIETTSRTQVFWLDPETIQVDRNEREGMVVVSMSGERKKLVAGKDVPDVQTQYRIHLTTLPRNPLNTFGIVIKNVEITSTPLRHLQQRRTR